MTDTELDEIMSLAERRAILTKIARSPVSRQLHANDIVNAIDLLNKIDGHYKQLFESPKEIVHTLVFLLPDGIRITPGLLPIGTVTNEPTITESYHL